MNDPQEKGNLFATAALSGALFAFLTLIVSMLFHLPQPLLLALLGGALAFSVFVAAAFFSAWLQYLRMKRAEQALKQPVFYRLYGGMWGEEDLCGVCVCFTDGGIGILSLEDVPALQTWLPLPDIATLSADETNGFRIRAKNGNLFTVYATGTEDLNETLRAHGWLG